MLNLGKMEKDYGYPMAASEAPEKDEKQVEVFPTTYIRLDSLPQLTPGQEVTLKGVVSSFEDRKVRKVEDDKEEIVSSRQCEIEIRTMDVGAKKDPTTPPRAADDEKAVDEGLDEVTEDDDEEED